MERCQVDGPVPREVVPRHWAAWHLHDAEGDGALVEAAK
jgi:hypothetical protein